MARFVILEHDHPALHWDFLLEHGSSLRSWRLASPPVPGLTISATAIADHRLAYLDYEGPVSGDRGAVTRWDQGEFEALRCNTTEVEVVLAGTRLKGVARLVLLEGSDWRFEFSFEESTGPRS